VAAIGPSKSAAKRNALDAEGTARIQKGAAKIVPNAKVLEKLSGADCSVPSAHTATVLAKSR
jgi:hypothetical protein